MFSSARAAVLGTWLVTLAGGASSQYQATGEWNLQYGHGLLGRDHREIWTVGYDAALSQDWWLGIAFGSVRLFRDDASRPAYASLRLRYRFEPWGDFRPHVGVELGATSYLIYGGSDSVWGVCGGGTFALSPHQGVSVDLLSGRATSDMDKSYPVDRFTHDRLMHLRAAYVFSF